MIKVYCDWNVISQMRNGTHEELKNIIFNNEKLFIPFSTAHIGDIFSSYKENENQTSLITDDLQFLSDLTNNKCLFNSDHDIVLDDYAPIDLFQQRIDEKDLFTDISLDGLGESLDPDLRQIFLEQLKSTHIDDAFKKAFENPESATALERIFPGLRANPTLEGFFKAFNEMRKGLNDREGYKDLRQIVQSGLGINRDQMFDSVDPFQMINRKYDKLNINPQSYITKGNHAPEWFDEITTEYLLLDMHGYQEDKVTISKNRKETFKNTTEDSFHCAFASTCNFLITNDNRSLKKTKVVYEKLNIPTVVFKPNEFVEYYKSYLSLNHELSEVIIPIEIANNSQFFESRLDGATLKTYILPYFLFDFFNKILLLIPDNGERPIFLLSQYTTSHFRVYLMELKKLYHTISITLGMDIDNYGEIAEDEFLQTDWKGRKWKLNNIELRLERLNGHFQLYYDFHED